MADLNDSAAEPGDGDDGAVGAPGTAVSWALAERVGAWAGNRKALPDGYQADELEREFADLTAQAEELVATSTGLRSPTGLPRSRVTDPAGRGHVNIASFQRLVGQHLDRLDPSAKLASASSLTARLAGPMASAGRVVTGTQMGLVLGW